MKTKKTNFIDSLKEAVSDFSDDPDFAKSIAYAISIIHSQMVSDETDSLGCIDINEFQGSDDIVRDKLEAVISGLLDKYEYGFALKTYSWRSGDVMPSAEIGIQKITAPSEGDEHLVGMKSK